MQPHSSLSSPQQHSVNESNAMMGTDPATTQIVNESNAMTGTDPAATEIVIESDAKTGTDPTAIEIVTERDYVAIEISRKLGPLSTTKRPYPCIYRATGPVYRRNMDEFIPKAVAIGPYNHGSRRSLKEMEDRKPLYLQKFLRREASKGLDYYVSAMRELVDKARKCYVEPIDLEVDEFVEMLLLDGCFIIEYIRNYWIKRIDEPYAKMRGLCQESFQTQRDIERDLLLMENQLPFFVLSRLSPNIFIPALRFVEAISLLTQVDTVKEIEGSGIGNFKLSETGEETGDGDIDHLLGLLHYRLFYKFSEIKTRKEDKFTDVWDLQISAAELNEAGVQFRKTDNPNLFDINFEDGVLEIPKFTISTATEYLYPNLVAYEQCEPTNAHGIIFCNYVYILDCLINSTRDVELLRLQGIIVNRVGDDETVCRLANNFSKELLETEQLRNLELFSKLNEYCRKRRHRYMATLRRKYFNSPWAFISFVAAVVLLGLTVAQTVFAALSYHW